MSKSARRRHFMPITPGRVCKVEQHHKAKCDIKRIVKSALRTGAFDHVRSGVSDPGFSPDLHFQDLMNARARAATEFEHLSPELRKHFVDYHDLHDCVTNPDRRHEAIKYGLITPPAPAGEAAPAADKGGKEPPAGGGDKPPQEGASV